MFGSPNRTIFSLPPWQPLTTQLLLPPEARLGLFHFILSLLTRVAFFLAISILLKKMVRRTAQVVPTLLLRIRLNLELFFRYLHYRTRQILGNQ